MQVLKMVRKLLIFLIQIINLVFRLAEISHFIRNSKSSVILCDNDIVDRMKNIVSKLNVNPMIVSIDDAPVDGAYSVKDLFTETGTEDTFRFVLLKL